LTIASDKFVMIGRRRLLPTCFWIRQQ